MAEQRKPAKKGIRQGIRRQLGYLKRNLKSIDRLAERVGLGLLPGALCRDLLVVSELCRQQSLMFDRNIRSVEDRIVSVSQPHVRPIVRGEAKAKAEFGAKISASPCEGYAFVDRIPIEGKFGQGKRAYGLGLVMTKLAATSMTAISLSFLVTNLEKWLKTISHAQKPWPTASQAAARFREALRMLDWIFQSAIMPSEKSGFSKMG